MVKILKLGIFFTALACLSTTSVFSADLPDRITLRSGSELRVKIISTVKKDNRSWVIFKTDTGSTVKIDRKLIANLQQSDEVHEAYLRHLKTRQDTVAWHREIVEWCKDQPQGRAKLRDEIRYHLEMILVLDPNDLKARKLLGYERVGRNQWMLKDLLFDRYGYEQRGGSVTPKLFRLIDQNKEEADESEGILKKQFKLWLRDIKLGRASKDQLQARLNQMLTPENAHVVFDQYAKDESRPGVRELFIEAFGNAPSIASTGALVYFSISDPVEDFRQRASTLLGQPQFDQKLAVNRMSEFLSNPNNRAGNNQTINEAAASIGELVQPGDNSDLRDVMLRLTDALVTTHKVRRAGAVEEGRLQTSFSNDGSTSFTAGGGPQTEPRDFRNQEVLATLKKMTGEDFGFNEDRWERYFVEHYSLVDTQVRTD